MPKMMFRKDIEYQVERCEKHLKEMAETPESERHTAFYVSQSYWTGRKEAFKDVLG